ncbi:hypothetical protein PHMEG_00012262 [Phytophthora megakarya]|uniref:Uncharacterized protein n=1 Tax=Phytophthora megakarya TaxID=4795 RepID=A0A225W9L8_9STRA|nr:hypothetical protein PHMEG_00012262 [Phytophthora megakarya]
MDEIVQLCNVHIYDQLDLNLLQPPYEIVLCGPHRVSEDLASNLGYGYQSSTLPCWSTCLNLLDITCIYSCPGCTSILHVGRIHRMSMHVSSYRFEFPD